MGTRSKTPEELLQFLFDKAYQSNGCLISHLAPNKKGYVPISLGGRNGKKLRAHRFVYEMLFGELLPEEQVMHDCDKRNCINPDHLSVGTAKENSEDMVSKGRSRNQTTAKVLGYVNSKSL